MSDLILNIAQKPTARRMIKRLRLPIPMPQKIRRADGAWSERPLNDQRILLAPQKSALGERNSDHDCVPVIPWPGSWMLQDMAAQTMIQDTTFVTGL